jgi:hypothetical protein
MAFSEPSLRVPTPAGDASSSVRRRIQELAEAKRAAMGEDPEYGNASGGGYLAGDGNEIPPVAFPEMESTTRRGLNANAAMRSNELVLPPGGPADKSYKDMQLPSVTKPDAPSPIPQEIVDAAVATAQGVRQRGAMKAEPPQTPARSAQRATQQYVDKSRVNADVRAALNVGDLAPAAAPESGTLPGEEQVSTRDTLRALSPVEQTALQRKFESGGHAQTMSYDDWLSENFAELPPNARVAQMRASATSAPRVQVGKDPTLPVGENSELAKSRLAAGGILPEGREATQYSGERLREMSRNVRNPDIPMAMFGGTFTRNPDGTVSSRAPNPEAMALADSIAKDPTQGPMSDSHVVALAQAYGIDVQKYGDDIDLLRSDVTREKERHDQLAGKYEVVPTGAGGFRYKPSEALRNQLSQNDLQRFARDLRNRNQGLQGSINGQSADDMLAAIDAAAGTPNGKAEMVRLGQMLRRMREGNQHQAVRNRAQNYSISQDLRNPNYAPGMAVRSLMAALDSNDPQRIAAVHDIFGNPDAGMQSRQIAAVQAEAAAELGKAVEERRAATETKEGAEVLAGEQAPKEFNAALSIADPHQRYATVERIVKGMNPELAADPAALADRVQNLIAGRIAQTNGTSDPFVQARIGELRNSKNKPAFKQFVMQIGAAKNDAEAEWMFNNPTPPKSARESGAEMAQNVKAGASNAVGNVAGFVSGLLSGQK